MYEYFIAYRWYGKWKDYTEGYGNFSLKLEQKISSVDDIQQFRDAIKKEFPDFTTIVIIFYSEFKI